MLPVPDPEVPLPGSVVALVPVPDPLPLVDPVVVLVPVPDPLPLVDPVMVLVPVPDPLPLVGTVAVLVPDPPPYLVPLMDGAWGAESETEFPVQDRLASITF